MHNSRELEAAVLMVDGNGAHMYFAGRVYARNHSIPAEHIAQSIQHCMLARAAAATVTAEMEQFHGAGGAPDRRQRWKNISWYAPSPWLQCHQRDRRHPTKCASAKWSFNLRGRAPASISYPSFCGCYEAADPVHGGVVHPSVNRLFKAISNNNKYVFFLRFAHVF